MSKGVQRVIGGFFAAVMTGIVSWLMVGWPATYAPPAREAFEAIAARSNPADEGVAWLHATVPPAPQESAPPAVLHSELALSQKYRSSH